MVASSWYLSIFYQLVEYEDSRKNFVSFIFLSVTGPKTRYHVSCY